MLSVMAKLLIDCIETQLGADNKIDKKFIYKSEKGENGNCDTLTVEQCSIKYK